MHTRIAAYALIIRDDEILLSHWRRGTMHGWTLPGGGIEPGEDPADACVREVFEETGLHAALGRVLGVDSRILVREEPRPGEDAQLHTVRIVYAGSVTGGTLTPELDGSSDDAAWFPLAEVPELRKLSLVDAALAMAERDDRSPERA
ncbi:NUDIX hydrolase [Leucobacter sp. M11]|uniref:NUDIX hydrolase n=1 Tax=Leucobacter sp. M11 TaxID=2993565 RepID=UPI002D7F59D7|nr:NUDIX hydrolase [Leucobacter sp. M11]MEB4614901.1 NUDIX hydrolase [Leucobacter sp. M11]